MKDSNFSESYKDYFARIEDNFNFDEVKKEMDREFAEWKAEMRAKFDECISLSENFKRSMLINEEARKQLTNAQNLIQHFTRLNEMRPPLDDRFGDISPFSVN